MTEFLFEAPDASCAVLFFGVGEVGLNKQIGALALFREKEKPRLVWQSERLRGGFRKPLFWFEGQPGEAVLFQNDLFDKPRTARLFEYGDPKGGVFRCRERILNLDSGGLAPPP